MSRAENEPLTQFGCRLRAARKRKRLSQAGAAELAGIAAGRWSDYEIGKIAPNAATLPRIAAALGMRVGRLAELLLGAK